MKNAFVVDFSGDNLTAGFVSEELQASGVSNFDLANFLAGNNEPLDKMVGLLAAKMRASPDPVDVVVLAFDCDFAPDRQRVLNIPNAPWLNGAPLVEALQGGLGKPVILERRANMFLQYDRVVLGLPQEAMIAGCYVNDGYEGALWCQGSLLLGKSGAAGNMGHMPVHGREDNCRCGKTGCIELYGAGYRLKQLHSLIFPDIPLNDIFVQHAEHPLLQDFLRMMVYPLAVEVNLLDPDFVILGGTVPTMPDFPLSSLEEFLREMCYHPFPGDVLALTPSAIRESDYLLCPAYYGFEKLATAGS